MPNKIVIRDEDFFRITQHLRESLPLEIKEARETLEKRDQILKNAHEEHRQIMTSAEKRLDDLLSQEQVVVAARREAEKIIERAVREGDSIKRDALAYTAEILADMQNQMEQTLSTIQRGREFIQAEMSVAANGPEAAGPVSTGNAEAGGV
jgi:hypothetical protein